ncbi:hypothetical protein K432DRAFT_384818 [Lepidopterella palustris CBS 459.81]|uniref:F-box domain-containing protein n=1 Tax=Lepidopterella palustris CBS 459.81 TaxID=1314670 RepID=A0A8E2JCT0_9PEZI|nr:hypothetical protein K432DRAFT_384818 [Lepidopterella palustris CBS 459.81]
MTKLIRSRPPPSRLVLANVVELLEQILSYLEPLSLLRLQRVNKHWQRVISSSYILRRELFLDPIPNKTSTDEPSINPFLQIAFPQYGAIDCEFTTVWDMDALLIHLELRTTPDDRQAEAQLYPDASWRLMYVTQPPISVVMVQDDQDRWEDAAYYFKDYEGATLEGVGSYFLSLKDSSRGEFKRPEWSVKRMTDFKTKLEHSGWDSSW